MLTGDEFKGSAGDETVASPVDSPCPLPETTSGSGLPQAPVSDSATTAPSDTALEATGGVGSGAPTRRGGRRPAKCVPPARRLIPSALPDTLPGKQYRFETKAGGYGHVHTYTRLPKILREGGRGGWWVDLALTLDDPRNFPDAKERAVIAHVLHQLTQAKRGQQRAYGPISLKRIEQNTGIGYRTLIKYLAELVERRILDVDQVRVQRRVRHTTGEILPEYHAGLHLPLSDWQVARLYVYPDSDDAYATEGDLHDAGDSSEGVW